MNDAMPDPAHPAVAAPIPSMPDGVFDDALLGTILEVAATTAGQAVPNSPDLPGDLCQALARGLSGPDARQRLARRMWAVVHPGPVPGATAAALENVLAHWNEIAGRLAGRLYVKGIAVPATVPAMIAGMGLHPERTIAMLVALRRPLRLDETHVVSATVSRDLNDDPKFSSNVRDGAELLLHDGWTVIMPLMAETLVAAVRDQIETGPMPLARIVSHPGLDVLAPRVKRIRTGMNMVDGDFDGTADSTIAFLDRVQWTTLREIASGIRSDGIRTDWSQTEKLNHGDPTP